MTESEAYFAGLFASDGCAVAHPKRGRPHARIAIQSRDREALDQLARAFNRKVMTCVHHGRPNAQEQAILTVYDLPLSWKSEKPLLDGRLEPAYFRGLMDGDGTITYRYNTSRTRKYYRLVFMSHFPSEPWMGDAVMDWLNRLDIHCNDHVDKTGIRRVQIWSERSSRLVARLMYEDASYFIPRKRHLALSF